MNSQSFAFNGKFLSAGPTGVHRVAEQLLLHADAEIAMNASPVGRGYKLFVPRDIRRTLPLEAITTSVVGMFTWQPWEQIDLPRAAKDYLLINLCNLAPLAHRNSMTMIHDAQVFISPESYSPQFRAWYQFALPRIGKWGRRILTVSEYSKQQLVAYGVAPAEKVHVVYNGADHFRRVAADPTILDRLELRRGHYVVALANAQRHKNIELLLRAFQSPDMAQLQLVLFGAATPEDFTNLGFQISRNVIFAGVISDPAMRSLFQHAAALAFPSLTEGFGLPPLEAMSVGCPVVAAPCGALPEVCGEAALYASALDASAWRERLLEVTENVALRARLATAGQQQAARFTWAASAQRVLALASELD